MQTGEFIDPSPDARRNLVTLGVGSVLLGATLKFLLLPALFSHIGRLPACDQAQWSVGLWIVSFGLLPVVLASWAGQYARKLLRAQQYPLPDAWVWRRTPIARGRTVRWRACALLGCSIALLGIAFFGCRALWPLTAAVASLCPA